MKEIQQRSSIFLIKCWVRAENEMLLHFKTLVLMRLGLGPVKK